MIASYLFNSEGLAALARYVSPDTLFAFDLDGTLAPIVEEYSAAQIAEPVRTILKRLSGLAKVAVITGRARKDAMVILGFEPHILVGNHGSEWPPHDAHRNWDQIELCLKWQKQLQSMLCHIQGVEIEFKGESVSLHYRKADDRETALARINTAIESLEQRPREIGGKFVVNLLPAEALTKGGALVAAMDKLRLSRSIYFGDDVTDEAVFQLNGVDVLGIHIGKSDQTAAQYYLKSQSELFGLLDSMVQTLIIM